MDSIRHNAVIVPLPPKWEDATQVVALAPVDSGFRPNLVVSQEPSRGDTPEKFASRQLPALRSQLQGLAVVKEGKASFGPNAGFLREHSFTIAGQKLTQLQFYVVRGETAFTLTFTHMASRIAQARKQAQELFGQTSLPG